MSEILCNKRGIIIYGEGNIRQSGAVIVASSQIGNRARICKRLRSPGIVSKESIPLVYVAWQASTTNRVVVTARPAIYYVVHRLVELIPGLLKRYKSGLSWFLTGTENFNRAAKVL